MTRLTDIRDEIMRRHVALPDQGADAVDAAIASAINDFYETAKGIEAAGDWVSRCLACRHDECTPQGCAYVYSGGEPCNCDPLQRARLHAAGVRVAAPPSDPAAPLDVERLARAYDNVVLRDHKGDLTQPLGAYVLELAAQLAREYAALGDTP